MRKTIIYTLTGIVSPALTLLLLPVYLKYLSTNDYVILALTNSFIAVFSIFFNFKTDQAYRTLFFYNLKNEDKNRKLFQTIFSFQLVSMFFWLLTFYFVGDWLFSIIFKNNISFFPYAFILLATFLVTNLCNLYFIHLQNNSKVKVYSAYFLSFTVLTHLTQLAVIFVFHLDFIWFLLSGLFASVTIFALVYSNNLSLFQFNFSRKIFREAILFSLPFIPFLLLFNLENQLDRFFIERYETKEVLVAYVVLLSIIGAILTFFNSIDNAVRPELYTDLAEKKVNMVQSLKEKLDFYWLIGILVFSFLTAFGTHIHLFLNNEKYNGISIYFPWITIAFLPVIAIRFYALQLVYEKQISKINWFSFVKIIVMTLLFFVLIPIHKIYGAIVAIGISNVLNLLVFYSLTTTKVLPSPEVIYFTMLFLGINTLLMFIDQANFISLIAIAQFLLFGFLFLKQYWAKIKKIKLS